jgi:hypothetical protein
VGVPVVPPKSQLPGVEPHTDVPLQYHLESMMKMQEKRLDERATAQKEAVNAALLAAKEAVNAALAAAEKAVVTARTAQEKVNEKQNEFRQALIDQQGTFLPRETYDTGHSDVTRRIMQLEADNRIELGQTNERQTSSSLSSRGINTVISALAALAGVGAIVAVVLTR